MSGPSLSTDQVETFVELARHGSLRAAAASLHVTEQGARSRLLALEARLGVQLYRKRRGPRRGATLTEAGERFLPHARAFLDRAAQLGQLFDATRQVHEVHVLGSQYLISYLLIDVVKRFHRQFPDVRIRLGTRSGQEMEKELLDNPEIELAVGAPYEPSPELHFTPLFSMHWSLITRPRHRLLKVRRLRIEHLADEPLILYERGSTGRQHVTEAFQLAGVAPRVEMEATNTDIVVRMVAAGLGVSLVPLLPNGVVTRGRRVASRTIGKAIRPIHSGVLQRAGEQPPLAARQFIDFAIENVPTQDAG